MNTPTGLSETQKNQIQLIFQNFLSDFDSWNVDVFGSRARGDHRNYSDLDLWIETSPKLEAEKMSDLREAFEESDLSIKIDLITPDSVLPAYESHIRAEKIPWIKKT